MGDEFTVANEADVSASWGRAVEKHRATSHGKNSALFKECARMRAAGAESTIQRRCQEAGIGFAASGELLLVGTKWRGWDGRNAGGVSRCL